MAFFPSCFSTLLHSPSPLFIVQPSPFPPSSLLFLVRPAPSFPTGKSRPPTVKRGRKLWRRASIVGVIFCEDLGPPDVLAPEGDQPLSDDDDQRSADSKSARDITMHTDAALHAQKKKKRRLVNGEEAESASSDPAAAASTDNVGNLRQDSVPLLASPADFADEGVARRRPPSPAAVAEVEESLTALFDDEKAAEGESEKPPALVAVSPTEREKLLTSAKASDHPSAADAARKGASKGKEAPDAKAAATAAKRRPDSDKPASKSAKLSSSSGKVPSDTRKAQSTAPAAPASATARPGNSQLGKLFAIPSAKAVAPSARATTTTTNTTNTATSTAAAASSTAATTKAGDASSLTRPAKPASGTARVDSMDDARQGLASDARSGRVLFQRKVMPLPPPANARRGHGVLAADKTGVSILKGSKVSGVTTAASGGPGSAGSGPTPSAVRRAKAGPGLSAGQDASAASAPASQRAGAPAAGPATVHRVARPALAQHPVSRSSAGTPQPSRMSPVVGTTPAALRGSTHASRNDYLSLILPWTRDDLLGEDTRPPLTPIPASFGSVDQLRQAFAPLIIEEVYSNTRTLLQKLQTMLPRTRANMRLDVKVRSVRSDARFVIADLVDNSNEPGRMASSTRAFDSLTEGVFVAVTNMSANGPLVLGMVQSVLQKGFTIVFWKDHPDTKQHIVLRRRLEAYVLEETVTSERQFEALQSIGASPLLPILLNQAPTVPISSGLPVATEAFLEKSDGNPSQIAAVR